MLWPVVHLASKANPKLDKITNTTAKNRVSMIGRVTKSLRIDEESMIAAHITEKHPPCEDTYGGVSSPYCFFLRQNVTPAGQQDYRA